MHLLFLSYLLGLSVAFLVTTRNPLESDNSVKSAVTVKSVETAKLSQPQGSIKFNDNIDLNLSVNLNDTWVGNNTLFTRWRPRYHFLAPSGWMNDPCGAMYDHNRDEYHMFYQYNPHHINWGRMSWGHAISKDMVQWADVGGWKNEESVALAMDQPYDKWGVYSGNAQPVNLTGHDDGKTLTIFYTSARHQPIHYSRPYTKGSESQSLATSIDGGRTWTKYEGNPVIDTAYGWNVTGWRDPFFQLMPEMDAILGKNEPHWYMVLSSGIRGQGLLGGPRMPLFSAPRHDLTNWTFMGSLFEPKKNESFGNDPEWTGSYGVNFEVSNFISLDDTRGEKHFYAITGAEHTNLLHHYRPNLWVEGLVTRRLNGSANFQPISSGMSDWGNIYALTAFKDTKNNGRRVQWGWSDEETNHYGANAQGWQGVLGLPRELYIHETYNLIPEEGSPFFRQGNFVTKMQSNGTFTAYTLGTRLLPDVIKGIEGCGNPVKLGTKIVNKTEFLDVKGIHLSISTTISKVTGPVGFIVRASECKSEYTSIVYHPSEHKIVVDRSKSSLIPHFANYDAEAKYYAPLLHGGEREKIDLKIFLDNSMLEFFVNGRIALTTRIYPSKALNATDRIGVLAAEGASALFEDITIHSKMMNVWHERPFNSSSQLVFDTPEQSGNYTYWSGM